MFQRATTGIRSHVNVSDTWQQFYTPITYSFDGITLNANANDPGAATAGVRFNSDGTVYYNNTDALVPGPTSNRPFEVATVSPVGVHCVGSFELATNSSGTNVVDFGSIDLRATQSI